MSSILEYVCKQIGFQMYEPSEGEETDPLEDVILNNINIAFAEISQLNDISVVVEKEDDWDIIEGISDVELNFIKLYVVIKTKLLFDPPENQNLLSAQERHLADVAWRISIMEVTTT